MDLISSSLENGDEIEDHRDRLLHLVYLGVIQFHNRNALDIILDLVSMSSAVDVDFIDPCIGQELERVLDQRRVRERQQALSSTC